MIRVAICIPTYQRPHGLDRLLESLSRLHFKKQAEPDVKIIVVDNDNAGTATSVVERWKAKLPWEVEYDIEPQRGIASARNRLVTLAEDVDFIAFIDDDEVTHVGWLDELLYTQDRYHSDIVVGPVLPRFEVDPPKWVLEGEFFERETYAEGEVLDGAATGNMLISKRVLSWVEGPFDKRMDLSGGEDSLLSMSLFRLGARIVFANRAIVEEFIPASRMTLGWICQRAYRGGNTYSLCRRYIEESNTWVFERVLKGLCKISLGFLLLFPSIVRGRAASVKALKFISLGAGDLSGILGKRYFEYKRIHGR